MTDLYSDRANERRKQFNNIIDGLDMVLMNNIIKVDPSVIDNFEGADPFGNDECDIEEVTEDGEAPKYVCNIHGKATDDEYQCEDYEENAEVYQWFAVSDSDADFLKRHGQYITYSDMLDTYFLAICHFGTGWDYIESMVSAFDDMYHGLDEFADKEAVTMPKEA